MKEQQNIEWKETWHPNYFKWICGFANAAGGTLIIGKDDNGRVKHLSNAEKLLTDIPNQVRDLLGLMVDVNLHTENEKDFLEIVVEPYPFPVSLRGKYYYRSGSTLQELNGAALTRFLLHRQGSKWDGVPVPSVSVSDLKVDSIDLFRKKASKSKRLRPADLECADRQLLEKLHLISDDGNMLKRAAVLLFHPEPEAFISGSYIKIGFFENETDLIFQDEVHGCLFDQIEKTTDLLFSKYIKAIVSYEGISRVETYEYPPEALREGLLNAIAHKDYAGSTPVQIKVFKDRIIIWNEGRLPEDWTILNLLHNHASRPYNPDVANVLYRSGFIESWGRGISKMNEQCLAAGLPEPTYNYTGSDFWVVFRKDIFHKEYLQSAGLNERQIKAVLYVKEKGKITNKEYQDLNNITDRTALRDLGKLTESGILIRKGEKKGAYYEISG